MRAEEFIPERVNAEVIEPGYSVRRQLPNGMIIQAQAMTPFLDDPDPYMRDLRGVTIRVFDPHSDSWIHDKFGIGAKQKNRRMEFATFRRAGQSQISTARHSFGHVQLCQDAGQ